MSYSSTSIAEVCAIGVDIGGTKVLAGLVDARGGVSDTIRLSTPSMGGSALLDTVRRAVQLMNDSAAARGISIIGCGVGTAGVVLNDVLNSANKLIPGWAEIPLAESLRSQLDRPVTVLNDVQAAAIAEVEFGAARGASSALIAAIGTGIGGALVRGGRVTAGRNGIAGSVGHMPAPVASTRICR